MSVRVLLFATVTLCAAASRAEELPFDDWRQADLIFQESGGKQSAAIRAATGSRLTHMGIVRITGAGPVVIEAARAVQETDLQDFIARGKRGRFAVYRLRGLTEPAAHMIIEAAYQHMGKPYDTLFRLESSSIYCSELPYYAFQSIGVSVGKAQRLGDLNVEAGSAHDLVEERAKKLPECKGRSQAACRDILAKQKIVTPISIARDARFERVFSNF